MTHLFFTDDTLLFLNSELTGIKRILDFLKKYYKAPGQKLNEGQVNLFCNKIVDKLK